MIELEERDSLIDTLEVHNSVITPMLSMDHSSITIEVVMDSFVSDEMIVRSKID